MLQIWIWISFLLCVCLLCSYPAAKKYKILAYKNALNIKNPNRLNTHGGKPARPRSHKQQAAILNLPTHHHLKRYSKMQAKNPTRLRIRTEFSSTSKPISVPSAKHMYTHSRELCSKLQNFCLGHFNARHLLWLCGALILRGWCCTKSRAAVCFYL